MSTDPNRSTTGAGGDFEAIDGYGPNASPDDAAISAALNASSPDRRADEVAVSADAGVSAGEPT